MITSGTCRRCQRTDELVSLAPKGGIPGSWAGSRTIIDPTEADLAAGKALCWDCATKRQSELLRSDERSALRARVKLTKENVYNNDCMIVATSVATGLAYEKVVTIARRYGWRPNDGRGPAMYNCESILREAAEAKGKRVERVHTADCGSFSSYVNPAPADYVREAPADAMVFVATMTYRGQVAGHAMSYTNGQLNNAHNGWGVRSSVSFAFRVTK